MKYSFISPLSPDGYLSLLKDSCVRWKSVESRGKNARSCRIKGGRFSLVQNGPYGRYRPCRVFSAAVTAAPDGGCAVRGSFRLSPGDFVFLFVLSLAIMALCVFGSWNLAVAARIFVNGVGAFCCAILYTYSLLVSKFTCAEANASVLRFLAQLGKAE